MTRRRLLLLAAFLCMVLAGCRVDGVVDITVDKDGAGTVAVGVSLDEEAQALVPDLAEDLRAEDLVAAGWEVTPPTVEADGLLWIRASKDFVDAEHFVEVMQELTGGAVFQDFRLERSRSFAQTLYEVSGTVDWRGGVEAFGDPALTESLLGVPLGYEEAELEALGGGPIDQRTELTVNVRLPDDAEGNAEQLSGSTGTWTVRPDDRTVTRIELSGTVEDTAPRVWAAVAVITGGLAVVLLLVGAVGLGVRRVRRPTRRPVRTRRSDEIVEAPPAPPPPRERRLELVVLGGTGVVFDAGDGDQGLLLPFVRAVGSTVPKEHVASCHRSASLGRITAAEFWREVGAEGDPDELDRAYLSRIRLTPGLTEFLDRVGGRGLQVACLTNAVLTWSVLLRERFGLDRRISPWIVSAEVGARKPSRAMFEALRRTTGVPFEHCLLIDSMVGTLEAGRKLGMSTVWFAPPGAEVPEGFPHAVVRGFDELLGGRAAGDAPVTSAPVTPAP